MTCRRCTNPDGEPTTPVVLGGHDYGDLCPTCARSAAIYHERKTS